MAAIHDESQAGTRSRVVTWQDPLPTAREGLTMSGLDFLRAIGEGKLPPPPIFATMGLIGATDLGEGHITFLAVPAEYHYNPIGVVHGGFAATLLDSAMGCAVHSALPAGVGYTTIEIKINYIRALTAATGEVRAEGRVIHVGGRMATAEGRLVGPDGTLYAHGTTTCYILRPKGAARREEPAQ